MRAVRFNQGIFISITTFRFQRRQQSDRSNVRFLCINVICLPRRSLGRDGQKLDKILSILRSNLLYVAGSGI